MKTANGLLPPTKSHKIRCWAICDFEGRDPEADALLTTQQDRVQRTFLVEEQHIEGYPAGTRQFILNRQVKEGEQVKADDVLEVETTVGPRFNHCSCRGFWHHKHCIHCDSMLAAVKCEAINRRQLVGV